MLEIRNHPIRRRGSFKRRAHKEMLGVEIDANMVSTPRTNPYVRADGWDDEVARIKAKKAAA